MVCFPGPGVGDIGDNLGRVGRIAPTVGFSTGRNNSAKFRSEESLERPFGRIRNLVCVVLVCGILSGRDG